MTDMSEPAFPKFYHLPVFFTLQPVAATRQVQMELWAEVLQMYIVQHPETWEIAGSCPVFSHPSNGCRLRTEAVQCVLTYAVEHGLAEWATGTSRDEVIWWRCPKQDIVAKLRRWAQDTGQQGMVFTLTELVDNDSVNCLFPGMPMKAVKMAVLELQGQGRAMLMESQDGMDGVKFV